MIYIVIRVLRFLSRCIGAFFLLVFSLAAINAGDGHRPLILAVLVSIVSLSTLLVLLQRTVSFFIKKP